MMLFSTTPQLLATAQQMMHHGDAEQAGHFHCPDGAPDGAPCSDSCQCLCCPGHSRLLPPNLTNTAQRALLSFGGVMDLDQDLHPPDVMFRIFHPPRTV